MNKGEKYLPVGTVVMLENGKKRVMITGFAATAPETGDKMYDYMGCLYPEGVISSDKNLLFDHDQIGQVYHMGLIDEEWEKVEAKIKEVVAIRLNAPEENEEEVKEEVNEIVESATNEEPVFAVPTTNDMFKSTTNEVAETPSFQVPTSSDMFKVDTIEAVEEVKEEPKVETQSSENMFRINTDLFN